MAAHCPLIAFLCLAGALLTAGAVVKIDQGNSCPGGWSLFGTRCFKFFYAKETWAMAERRCHDHGANLASIHSAEENAFIHDLIKGTSWLGGHDAVQEGLWMWTDGSRWDYTNWWKGEPNDAGRREHILMTSSIGHASGFWNDYLASAVGNYICAKSAAPVSMTLDGFLYKCTP